MSSKTCELVKSWVDGVRLLTPNGHSKTVHLDQLLGADYRPAHALVDGLAALDAAIEIVTETGRDMVPLVVFPLEDSERIDVDPPAVAEYRSQTTREPPSLALVRAPALSIIGSGDEYRVPLFDFGARVGSPRMAWYRCWRPAEGVASGWTFSRAVYVGSFTPTRG